MNNIDLMNYWIDSSNNDYDTMNVLFSNKKYMWYVYVNVLMVCGYKCVVACTNTCVSMCVCV